MRRITKKDLTIDKTDEGSVIAVVDELPPEDIATLQALNSREPGGFMANIDKVIDSTGSLVNRIIEKFYVGYGHKSIGDCGFTTVFWDKTSLLAAKSIQNWPIYSGQETSTRYVDVSGNDFVDPLESEESNRILMRWMSFFQENMEEVREHVRRNNPIEEGQNETAYTKAVNARAFDIMRGFLPAGAKTNVSCCMNLRQFHEHLVILQYHKCHEIALLANQTIVMLQEKYPNSFNHKEYQEQEDYRRRVAEESFYFKPKTFPADTRITIRSHEKEELNDLIESWIMKDRPVKTEPPKWVDEAASFRIETLIDFGSYRDVQRHRHGVNRMPLLTTEYGFEEWYVDSLPKPVFEKACELINEQVDAIKILEEEGERPEDLQYLTAIGFKVPWRYTCGLLSAIYFAELRSGTTVHPTARRPALELGRYMESELPGLTLHCDFSEDTWDVRRGTHDIVQKTS